MYLDAVTGKTGSISTGSGEPHMRPGYKFPDRAAAEQYLQMLQREEAAVDAAKAEGQYLKKKQKAQTRVPDEYVRHDAGHAGNDGTHAGVQNHYRGI